MLREVLVAPEVLALEPVEHVVRDLLCITLECPVRLDTSLDHRVHGALDRR